MNVSEWAEKLTEEVYFKNEIFGWSKGFVTFYTPVVESPDLLIISLQPRGREKDYTEDKKRYQAQDFSFPRENAYGKDKKGPFARNLKKLLDDENRPDLLGKSVAIPLIFFRAPDYDVWKLEIGNKREELESFCVNKVGNYQSH